MLKDIFIVYVYTGAYRTGNRYIEEVFDTEAAAEDYVSQQSIPEDYEIEKFYMNCDLEQKLVKTQRNSFKTQGLF